MFTLSKVQVRDAVAMGLVVLACVCASARAATPEISSVLQASAPINQAFSYTITATNTPVSFAAAPLPTGLSLAGAVISGTPTVLGTTMVTLGATNASGTGNATLAITVYDPNVGGAPVISSDTAFSMVVNTAAANVYQITAANTPTSFGATNLPAGLAVNASTGVISATSPTAAAGQYTITVTAANASGTGSQSVVVVINPSAGGPVITNSASETDNQNATPPILAISATGSPVSYAATGLPAGVTLNPSTGQFTGLNAGSIWALATYFATDAQGRTGVKTVLIQIFPVQNPPNVTSGTPPVGTVGQPYSYQMAVDTGGTSFNAVGLLSGLTMNTATGLISGTPTASGQFTVSLSSTLVFGRSNAGTTGFSSKTIVINPAPPSITSTLSVSGTVGTPISYQIIATGNPSSFNATGLPAGLSVNASGLISGTPTAAGTFSVLVSASKAGLTGTATVTFTIAPPASPIITSAFMASATKGSAFTYSFTASGVGPITLAVSGLPAGLTFSGSTISGTPTVAGQVFISLMATNVGGTTTIPLQLNIAGIAGAPETAPAFDSPATATPNPALTGATVTFTASGTDAEGDLVGFSWEFGDGLSGVGASVTHVYTAAGVYTVKVTISDGTLSDTRTLSIGVNDPSAPAETFTAAKTAIKFNFKKQAQDSLSLSGTVTLPSGFALANKNVVVGIGSLQQSFVLSAKGKSGTTSSSFTLALGKNRPAKYSLSLKKQDLFTSLKGLGFTNATVARPGTQLSFPVTVSIDGVSNSASVKVTYTATQGKSGAAK